MIYQRLEYYQEKTVLFLSILEIMTVRSCIMCMHSHVYIISGVTATLSVSDSNVKEGNKCKVTVSLNQAANTKIGFLISSITRTATGIQFALHVMLMYFF